jgi:hypothetical protein
LWTGLLLVGFLIAAVWRFRSWLMGVFENVEILGTSGADVESELLHHQTSDRATGTILTPSTLPKLWTGEGTMADQSAGETTFDEPESTGGEGFPQSSGPNDIEHPPVAGAISPPDASLSAEPEAPASDPGANAETEAIDTDTKPPLES